MHPGVQRAVEILAGARAPDRRALEDEQRDRQERDRGHLLVHVLGDGIDRSVRHEDDHERGRDEAERERDRHAGEHGEEGCAAVEKADRQRAHAAPWRGTSRPHSLATTWSRSWTLNRNMPTVISE